MFAQKQSYINLCSYQLSPLPSLTLYGTKLEYLYINIIFIRVLYHDVICEIHGLAKSILCFMKDEPVGSWSEELTASLNILICMSVCVWNICDREAVCIRIYCVCYVSVSCVEVTYVIFTTLMYFKVFQLCIRIYCVCYVSVSCVVI